MAAVPMAVSRQAPPLAGAREINLLPNSVLQEEPIRFKTIVGHLMIDSLGTLRAGPSPEAFIPSERIPLYGRA
jgi:hypothetical protein